MRAPSESGPGQGGSSGFKGVRQTSGEWLDEAHTTVAAFTMFLGPGMALNFYIASVGYYQYAFETRLFFVVMLFAAYGPFPLIVAAQAVFDAYFDRRFTTQVTYPVPISVGQLSILALVLMWMYLPVTEVVAIGIGLALGASCCLAQASGHQMISAIDATKLTVAEMGGQVGSVVPIVMIWMLDFKPSATRAEFREFVVVVAIVNFLGMAMLLTLHKRGLFDKAYVRLAYGLDTRCSESDEEEEEEKEIKWRRQVSKEAGETRLQDEPMESSYRRASKEVTPLLALPGQNHMSQKRSPREGARRELSSRQLAIPNWVYIWQATKCLMTALMSFIVSLAGFYGNSAHTQFLASVKLASDFVGRASALPLVRSECFGTGPWHRFLVSTAVARVAMVAIMLAQLWRPVVPEPIFVALWCLFAVLDRMMSTLSDVTCGAFVTMKQRKFVSRLSFFTGFGGLILGLSVAALLGTSMASRMDKSGTALLGTGSQGFLWEPCPLGLHRCGLAGDVGWGRYLRVAVPHFAMDPR